MKNFQGELISQKTIASGYQEMEFTWPRDAAEPKAGQFLTIKIQDVPLPLLRRPFALSGFDGDRASIIYQVRGTGTKHLSTLSPGAKLDILSPLGNSFSMPADGERPVLIAGGIGLGPILYFARSLVKAGKEPLFVFGCRTASFIPQMEELGGGTLQFCTDDGSEGFKGTSVDYLASLDQGELENARLYACGPTPMLKGCHDFALSRDLPCETAMEEMMACGVGACMGCVVKLAEGQGRPYARVCKDGPVFQSRMIEWT